MKKVLFVFLIVLALGSCKNEFDDIIYTINNKTKATDISFDFYNDINITVKPKPEEPEDPEAPEVPDESIYTKTINSGEGIFKPLNHSFPGHPASIKMDTVNKGRAGIEFNFVDVTPIDLYVSNTLPVAITIQAGIFIDDGNGNTELTIPANSVVTDAKIYTTKNPPFSTTSTTSNLPVRFNFKIEKTETEPDVFIETGFLIIDLKE